MMHLWVRKNAKRLIVTSTAVSIVMHAAVITGWVVGTLPTPGLPPTSIANHIFYLPPPDRVPTQPGSREAIKYIKTDAPGPGTGAGPRMMGEARPAPVVEETVGKPTETKDTVTAPAV